MGCGGSYKAFEASSSAPSLIFEAPLGSSVCVETETQDLYVLNAQIRTLELTRKGVCVTSPEAREGLRGPTHCPIMTSYAGLSQASGSAFVGRFTSQERE